MSDNQPIGTEAEQVVALGGELAAHIAAARAEAAQVLQAALAHCSCGVDHPYREPKPMTVNDLHALLAEHIAHGRGDDDLYVYPGGGLADVDAFMDAWGAPYNYRITAMDWTDDNDHFVTLTIDRDPEES